jgi:hypothetical protein
VRKSSWGEFGSFWNFVINNRPGKPSVFEVAEMSVRAHRELSKMEKEIKADLEAQSLKWDPQAGRGPVRRKP